MFVKFTRYDNTPVYLNAAYIVTIEPRRGGGSILVPIGDGLDYEVKESPEEVLKVLDAAPVPTIVPVPSPTGLTPTPDDVSPDSDTEVDCRSLTVEEQRERAPKPEPLVVTPPLPETPIAPAPETPVAPAKTTRTRKKATTTSTDAPKPARKPRTTRKAKAPEPALTLTPELLARLHRMAPKSIKKLQNTLVTQFKVTDAAQECDALVKAGIITLERDHIIWSTLPDAQA